MIACPVIPLMSLSTLANCYIHLRQNFLHALNVPTGTLHEIIPLPPVGPQPSPHPETPLPLACSREGSEPAIRTGLERSVRKYHDGREVCEDSLAGRREYLRRLGAMLTRQGNRCCLCCRRIYALHDATFEHQRRRGMGSAWRDDRIVDAEGQWINWAAHWTCNHERG
jgi:hypothetical protein